MLFAVVTGQDFVCAVVLPIGFSPASAVISIQYLEHLLDETEGVTSVTLTCAQRHRLVSSPYIESIRVERATRRFSPSEVTVTCEEHHGGCQGQAPKCVISQAPLWELSQSGAQSSGGLNWLPTSHVFSATWKSKSAAPRPLAAVTSVPRQKG